jgi:membrane fusion protein, multidrug efflux system
MYLLPLFRRLASLLLASCLLSATIAGCHRQQAPGTPPPPVIPVSRPVERQVTDFVDFTGRIDAIHAVGVRARVTGYLVQMPFREGAEVKKGDLLFEIDPRPYQALVDQAQSQVVLNQAQLRLAKTTLERDMAAGNAIAPQQIDQDKAAVEEATARIDAAKATLAAYKLNLEFTRVTSPIDGTVSRFFYTLGNLVTADQTLLTTVVSLDPIYVYFDVDERTVLRVRNAINRGTIQARGNANEIPVLMQVDGEDNFPHQGTLDFVNNVVNPSTGTIAARGIFANPLPRVKGWTAMVGAAGISAYPVAPAGRRLLSPGMFARVRLPIGQPHDALLVTDEAIGSDQGLRFVYVIDNDKRVQYRRVTTGPLQEDGLRVIEGVAADEWVVVGGLQQVRPRMIIEPEEMAMPLPASPANGQAPPPVSRRPQPPPPGAKTPQQAPGDNNAKQ